MKNYTTMTPVDEPIEVRLRGSRGLYVLWAWNDDGIIRNALSRNGAGMAESLSNLQSKVPFPRKAVQGWQAEVVAFAKSGLFGIEDVR